ncbi:hypothetical protein M0802_016203 [Mischocyttarus mexicanus]|nr:hypothetical protein M0802_016203 [Mischocyttarus mexicanus]
MGKLGSNPLAGLAALGLGSLATPANTGGINPAGKINKNYYIYIYIYISICIRVVNLKREKKKQILPSKKVLFLFFPCNLKHIFINYFFYRCVYMCVCIII